MTKNLLLRSIYSYLKNEYEVNYMNGRLFLNHSSGKSFEILVKEAELDEFHNISFKGKTYPARRINLGVYGVVDVSIASLEIALLNEDGSVKDGEAERIDDGIFFYVEDDEITLPLDELKRTITDSL
jgi:hypothetical protein